MKKITQEQIDKIKNAPPVVQEHLLKEMLDTLREVVDERRPMVNADSLEEIGVDLAEWLFELAYPLVDEGINSQNN